MKIFAKIIVIVFASMSCFAGDVLGEIRFGTLSIIHPNELKIQFGAFTDFLETLFGEKVVLEIGRDYRETIQKLASDELDIGFIGPVPYLEIKDSVDLLATIETNGKPFFRSVIVTNKLSKIKTISDLKGKRFAFGSPHSTLSFYIPAHILLEEGVLSSLAGYSFLNKHDKVAKNVINGKYDAGGIKESVYLKYSQYLKVVSYSKDYYDFVFVTSKSFGRKKKDLLRNSLLSLDDPTIVSFLKKGATGFRKTNYENYREIDKIIDEVNSVFNLDY